jgi:hypothetical protein
MSDAARAVPSPLAPGERDRLARALTSLSETVAGVVTQVEARIDERCPYRTSADLCTFRGGCENQRRTRDAPLTTCGGDHHLRRTPHDEP